MSALLWQAYFNDDLDAFKQLLAAGAPAGRPSAAVHPSSSSSSPHVGNSGRALLSVSPNTRTKSKSDSRQSLGKSRGSTNRPLSRTEVNSRDAYGVNVLHMVASCEVEGVEAYATALLENPLLDLYVQDLESGWTALHRALYAGNISIAQALMAKDIDEFTRSGGGTHAGGLIKIKDREGNSPFDVYTETIAPRSLPNEEGNATIESNEDDDEDQDGTHTLGNNVDTDAFGGEFGIGDELFMFGSNKNLTLGFGDEDDRHFPEKISLKRPQILLDKLCEEHAKRFPDHTQLYFESEKEEDEGIPALAKFRPIQIQEVELSKLHTAVLTTDPQANLYMCGFGPGGRLGAGDQATKFQFCSVIGGGLEKRKITAIGLGQDHTIAVSSDGEVFTWGSNRCGQLGYTVAMPNKDDEPMQLTPKQILGQLKRETIVGCSASRTHSVVFTSDSLYTFGKNDGQLGLVDADARSIEKQVTPRKVAASILANGIKMASAIDKATVFLLENHEVWVFANYGYAKMTFPLSTSSSFIRSSFSASSRHAGPNHIVKICGGGDTICGLARTGEVFTATVTQKTDQTSQSTSAVQIRGVISPPQRIWSLKKDHMAVHDVDVGQDGSVIICTNSGSVWRRVKRAKIKDSNAVAGATEHKPKDYKFSRTPGLTHISAVRANAFGAFAAIRSDCSVLKTQIAAPPSSLWKDVFPLLSFHDLRPDTRSQKANRPIDSDTLTTVDDVRLAVLTSKDIQRDLNRLFESNNSTHSVGRNINLGTTSSSLRIPAHRFILMARSAPLREWLTAPRQPQSNQSSEICSIEHEESGSLVLIFRDLDILSVLNLLFYLYTDNVLAFWNLGRQNSQNSSRYRHVRLEVMRLATKLDMPGLERAARTMTDPSRTLHTDFDGALAFPNFLRSGDIEVALEDAKVRIHSAFVCQRCPFFEGMFHGRAGGGWLTARMGDGEEQDQLVNIDLQHVRSATFAIVVRYLYGDAEDELFAHCATADLDDFLDIVLDVLAVANELMIDRLAHLCQKALGRYVTTRNVCWLLNEVAPCSVTRFKVAALEYICMNLEGMLENRRLDELDEDLLHELGAGVKANQLAYMPYVRSGRAMLELYDNYPELAEQSTRAKQAKVDYMTLQSHVQEDEIRMARLSKSPALKARVSSHDLMFNMDEDDIDLNVQHHGRPPRTPDTKPSKIHTERWSTSPPSSLPREDVWYDSKGKAIDEPVTATNSSLGASRSKHNTNYLSNPQTPPQTSPELGASPWTAPLQTSKLGIKEIMDQANENRTSSLATAISSSIASSGGKNSGFAKLSQKERKKALQAQKAPQETPSTSKPRPPPTPQEKASPWKTPTSTEAVSIKEEIKKNIAPSPGLSQSSRQSSSGPSLTMRQTLAGGSSTTNARNSRTAPDVPIPPRRNTSSELPQQASSARSAESKSPGSRPALAAQSQPGSSHPPIVPQSIRHITPVTAAEPSVQLSMADILALQQSEKDVIKEAAAKRSLQEIQEEQEFQEWWDQEEAATKARMEQEAAQQARSSSRRSRGGQRRRGLGRNESSGGKDKANDQSEAKRGQRSSPGKNVGPSNSDASVRSAKR